MGLFDFVKGIGKKNTAAAEPQPAPAPQHNLQSHLHKKLPISLLGHVKALGLPVTGLVCEL